MAITPWPGAPVAVLGAGPVGQTTALLLARWGVPTVVLDQRPARDAIGSKAICQQRDVLDIWAAVGAGEQIAAEGVTWTTARTFHRDAELFSYTFAEAGRSAFPPFVNISQTRTEQILDERIAAEPLIELRWGQRVRTIEQDADGVVLRCTTGSELRAPYLVVCCGARDEGLRAQLGVSFAGHSFDDRFLICDIRAELPGWATERRFYFDPEWNPGRQVLIHPCPDSTFRIDWQVPAGYDLDAEAASGALDARIRAIIGERDYEIVWSSVYRFHSRCVDRMRVGRALLAGDAAHLVSPFGARGLNSGVADAENAAWKIAYVGRGWAPPELLETYHDERHAAALENIEITTATMDFLVPPDAAKAQRRATVLAGAANDPELRAQVNSGRLAEPFWYVDSPLTTTSLERPFTGRPPRGQVPAAGPGVLLPDAPVLDPGATPPPGAEARPAPVPDPVATPPPGAEARPAPVPDPVATPPPGAEARPAPVPDPDAAPPPGVGAGPSTEPGAEATPDPRGAPRQPESAGSRPATRRARQLARDGFLLLVAPGVELAAVHAAAAMANGPTRVLALSEIDPAGTLTAALAARPGEVWLVRPDAHIAAVLVTPHEVDITAALQRAAANRKESHDGALQAIR